MANGGYSTEQQIEARETIAGELDRQEALIASMGKPFSSDAGEGRDVFSDFTRGVYTLKKTLWQYREVLTPEDFVEIRRRMQEQGKALDRCVEFLERSLGRVIR